MLSLLSVAFAACGDDDDGGTCCDPDEAPIGIEGGFCCADGTWVASPGGGLDDECDDKGGEGVVCEE